MFINANIQRVRLETKLPRRPSKITVPQQAHPFAKLVFQQMQAQNVTYDELEHLSGVLRCTIKAWRKENKPGLDTIEACLGALGWALVPVPQIDLLPEPVRELLAEVGQHFASDPQTYGAALKAAAEFPGYAIANLTRDPKQAQGGNAHAD